MGTKLKIPNNYHWETSWQRLSKAQWLEFIRAKTETLGYYLVNYVNYPQLHQVPELRRLIKDGKIKRQRIGSRTALMVL